MTRLLVAVYLFGWSFPFIFAQFCAKAAGGLVWSFVLRRSPGEEWLARNRALYGRVWL